MINVFWELLLWDDNVGLWLNVASFLYKGLSKKEVRKFDSFSFVYFWYFKRVIFSFLC
jgi:hypothetical protein